MSDDTQQISQEEIVEMVSRSPSVGRRRSSRGSSPQTSFVLPRSRSSTTILLRNASRTRLSDPNHRPNPGYDDSLRKNPVDCSVAPGDGASSVKNVSYQRDHQNPLPPPEPAHQLRVCPIELHPRAAVWQCTLVEFAVTLIFTFVSIAAVIACLKAQFSFPRIAIAFTQFLIYTACILAAAPVSGGHLNPSFSFATMLTGHTSLARSILYIVAQSAGSVAGAFFVKLVVSTDLSNAFFLGGCLLKQPVFDANMMLAFLGADPGQGLASEVFFTFLLISVAFPLVLEYSTATHFGDPRLVKGAFITGLVLGLLIFVSGELLSPGYTSAGMNPARCFGPAMAQGGTALLNSQWVFWVGPLVAGLIFALLYRIVHWHPRSSRTSEETQSKLSNVGLSLAEEPAPTTAAAVPLGEPTVSAPGTALQPTSQPNEARRMDVYLHIKAMMHRQENDNGASELREVQEKVARDVEQANLRSIEQPTPSSNTATAIVIESEVIESET